MAKKRDAQFSFIISTPQNQDRQSLALRQAHARSHAAKVSRSLIQGASDRTAHELASPQQAQSSRRQSTTTPDSQGDSHTSQHSDDAEDDEQAAPTHEERQDELDYDRSDLSLRHRNAMARHRPSRIEVSQFAVDGRHRQRRKMFPDLSDAYVSSLKVDPLHWIPYQRHQGVYVALGHFVKVSAPTVRPLYEMFNITSTYTALLFEFILGSEAFYHTAVARLLITSNKSRNPGPGDDSLVTMHQTIAIRQLREEIDKTAVPTDLMLLTILFLITIDVATGQSSSVDMHRSNLARLVKLRGGLDNLGYDGFVKATIKQFDDIFSFERGPGPLLPPIEYHPTYPSRPFSREVRELVYTIPEGFQYLALQQLLPLDVLELTARISNAVRRCGGKNTYVPLSRTANPFHSRPGRYDSFSDACPCLFAPEAQVYTLLKPLTLALAVWCCNAYSEMRSAGLVITGFLRSLTKRLQQMPVDTGPSIGIQNACFDERECWIWIWMVGVDAWTSHDGQELLPTGKELFQCFKARFSYETANPSILDGILEKFFFMNDFRVRVQSLWNESPMSSPT